ncbi:MAG: SusF/SusE family outer membrane protein [Bacteroidales bacterium]
MKKTIIYKYVAALTVMTALLVACTEETAQIRLDPKLATSETEGVSSDQATVIGFVIAEGAGFTERGVCYDTLSDPTIDNNKAVYTDRVEGATFKVTLTGLDYATDYYAKAYATGKGGTIYGEEVTFTTRPVAPTVTSAEITDISYTTATGGGEVTVAGGADVTARGVCYSTSENPTVSDQTTSDGDGLGDFTSSLTGLDDGTMYYVRAYATNSAGTGYGPEVTFTTLEPLNRTWNVPGDYVVASYPGSELGDWAPDASPQIKSGLSAPDNLEGYVYMANPSNEWKFATKPNWDGPNYGDGGSGTLSEAGGNMVSDAGYYFIQADAAELTYSAVDTEWGVTGDASPQGWDDKTVLTYQPALQQWTGGMHLTEGGMKFRANDNWDYNYGSSAGNDTLNAGGDNIAVAVEGDYAITLDLSKPLQYTYRADMWGVIGSATPNGWSDPDTDMTWDPVDEVFTVTLDLVEGEMKFRANNAWDYDLGGDPGALEAGGANIAVTTAGNYTITLDPWNLVATITLN